MHLFRRGTSSLFNSSNTSLVSSKTDATTDAVGGDTLAVDGFKSVPESDRLFAKPDPAVDGEDCLHDCATCTVKYPAKFDIDMEDKLYGEVKGWATHILVATGKSDWVRDVADEAGSVMEAIEKGGLEPSNGPTNVLLLPSFTVVENVTPQLAPDLIENYVNKSLTTTTPLGAAPACVQTEAGEKIRTSIRIYHLYLYRTHLTLLSTCGSHSPLFATHPRCSLRTICASFT
ncbi:hypothetical protein N7468_007020 [Penicillium chermesinum]|uniref:Uncharacterized protein n=1 Tax=Penicillium chermesinum TaxID=63820 RepID=A0A9W9NTC4_9EURO|nr:uncharacterized protein N7468_007020 [Penicillium chermesinum]KAJ5225795.1 hypothetical protein N7468_007020 [Penicillium chermesinum]